MRAHAPNQLSERSFAGRSGIEQERRRAMRSRCEDNFFNCKIDIGKVRMVACPAFRGGGHGRAQNFAALNIRRVVFLFRRLGMERTFTLRRGRLGRNRAERAMIENCDPGDDGDRNSHAAHGGPHAAFNRRRAMKSQMFSFGSTTTSPTATPDDGTTSSGPA